MMQCCNVWIAKRMLLFLTIACLAACGCDKVGSVVDDVKSTVSETVEPSTTPIVQAPPQTPPPAPETPPPPAPEQLLAEFKTLQPAEITDDALARVTSQPAAASAITELEIHGDKVTAVGVQYLAAMPNLASLILKCPSMHPDALARLGGITSLKSLGIGATQANDAVVESVASLPGLESLDLSSTPVTPAIGTSLSRISNLQVLNLGYTVVDDTTVAGFARLPIRELDLSRTRITNASLAIIRKIGTLESLVVPFCGVTGAGFQGYGASGLKLLNVGETPFGLDGFVAIKGMKSLENLNVYAAGLIEHKSADVFGTFPSLKILNAGGNGVTDAGMEVFFKGLKKIEELILSSNKSISDRGLSYLVGLKTLRILDVRDTACSANGGQALKQKLKECEILTSAGVF